MSKVIATVHCDYCHVTPGIKRSNIYTVKESNEMEMISLRFPGCFYLCNNDHRIYSDNDFSTFI